MKKFTSIYKKTGDWYSAWVKEIPGINTQGKTLEEAKKNLEEAASLILKDKTNEISVSKNNRN